LDCDLVSCQRYLSGKLCNYTRNRVECHIYKQYVCSVHFFYRLVTMAINSIRVSPARYVLSAQSLTHDEGLLDLPGRNSSTLQSQVWSFYPTVRIAWTAIMITSANEGCLCLQYDNTIDLEETCMNGKFLCICYYRSLSKERTTRNAASIMPSALCPRESRLFQAFRPNQAKAAHAPDAYLSCIPRLPSPSQKSQNKTPNPPNSAPECQNPQLKPTHHPRLPHQHIRSRPGHR
jgi:hypothetical protein